MCGIIGVTGTPNAASEITAGLLTLQHRGQDSAGILTCDETFHLIRGHGTVSKAIHPNEIRQLTGSMGIGHTRYATMGDGTKEEIQPHVLSYPYGIGMAHNGNIVNYDALSKDLKLKRKRHTSTKTDIEVILNLFADNLSRKNIEVFTPELIFETVGELFEDLIGAYSVVGVLAGEGLFGFRDPMGIRPLVLGEKKQDGKSAWALASESGTLRFLGYEVSRDVEPGEVIFIDMDGTLHSKVMNQQKAKRCMFEWVYFASPDSVLDGFPVYSARLAFGKSMARKTLKYILDQNLAVDIVVPVPDSSRPAAIALAESLRIPYREALIKNRYVQRTFILETQEKREKAVEYKLSPVISEIEGKNILLVDDSIVRGTTSKQIVKLMRKAGAKKVYLASTCPPIINPCYYGIDFPNASELIANGKKISEIKELIDVDELIYTDLEDIESSIGTKDLCMACLDGKYPTKVDQAGVLVNSRNTDRQSSDKAKELL